MPWHDIQITQTKNYQNETTYPTIPQHRTGNPFLRKNVRESSAVRLWPHRVQRLTQANYAINTYIKSCIRCLCF